MLQLLVQGIATLGTGAFVMICLIVAMRNDSMPMDEAKMDSLRYNLTHMAYAGRAAK